MDYEIFLFIGLALVGGSVHVLGKLAKIEKVIDFKFSVWLDRNKWSTISTYVGIIGAVIALYSMGSEQLNAMSALFLGYTVDSFFKNMGKLKRQ